LAEDEDGDEDGEIGLAIEENEVTMYVPFHLSILLLILAEWVKVYSSWIKRGIEVRANQQSEPERTDRIDNCGINE